ncbi:nucleoside hydrolase [Dehalobacterium formicoaceticum]|uniref:Nucleoside hydrolase n=1 Tax=Dehalobacterium formicoaceticum TaxID=51515 RepID=A0ABT1Y141_9FIRM|nr:nucleoside hydrolase [Dehalobacterium formicoaceticum]MCR6544579.1 nucleoside hydrolase [Dehalobacterium formicoaceticum]
MKLLTTVMGNISVDQTTNNMLKLTELFNVAIPVAKGNQLPLLCKYEDAVEVHGETGMKGYNFPEPSRKALERHAVAEMKDCILNSKEKITIVAIGPLTNLALLLSAYPEVKQKIAEIVIMGGSTSLGNMTSSTEFNIYVDPHAAQMVLQSGLPITMFGLNVTDSALLKKKDVNQIKTFGKAGEMLYAILTNYRGGSLETGLKIHDACTIAYLLNPALFKFKDYFMEVALEGPAAGTTVADLYMKYHDSPNVKVCIEIDAKNFPKWIVEQLGNINR